MVNGSADDELSASAQELPTKERLLTEQYRLRSEVEQYQRVLDQTDDIAEADGYLAKLLQAHDQLAQIDEQLKQVADITASSGLIIENGTQPRSGSRGPGTTKLSVKVFLELAQVPTSICHLLNKEEYPLIRVVVKNGAPDKTRRVRVRSYVQDYSAEAVTTIELGAKKDTEDNPVLQMPTFFPDRLRGVTELTRATLNVIVDDLDTQLVELHETWPLWLLARNSAPLRIKQPTTGEFKDMLTFLGAFVTPHEATVLQFLSTAAARHPQRRLDGYFATMRGAPVASQVRAVFDALKQDVGLTYISSFIDFNPDGDSQSQRVRLPRESLSTKQANCLDGALLFASVLEAISLQPALVYVPGHQIVAWRDSGISDKWTFLDTTKIGTCSFDEAVQWGFKINEKYEKSGQDSYRFMPIADLREKHGITPLE